jgi:hypothetical protein
MSQRLYRMAQLATRPGHPPGKIPASPAAIWRWIRNGHFVQPFKLSPGLTVFDADDVDAWLKAHKSGQTYTPAEPAPAAPRRNPVAPSTRTDTKRPGRPKKAQVAA